MPEVSRTDAARRYAALLARLDGVRGLGVELGLPRMRAALARLGDPQRRFAALQIAGTNGKGSTAAMTEALLRAAGMRTGLYTSPHLARFTERIRLGDPDDPDHPSRSAAPALREADGGELAELDARIVATGVPLTYFEVATALAFLQFAEAGVDVAVLETGLGGRLDAVTTCEPLATAITSIGLDHTEYLGPTLRDVAREKAGILKPGIPCFLGPLPEEAANEIDGAAEAAGAPLARLGRDFPPWSGPLALLGPHQTANAGIAVALGRHLAARLGRPLGEAAIADALARVRWPGRLEWIAPDVLVDCAHNADGARSLAAALAALPRKRPLVLVMSIVGDKDVDGILRALAPSASALVATRSSNSRALATGALAGVGRDLFSEVAAVDDPLQALATARAMARALSAEGAVLVCGSMFLVGALRAHLLGEAVDPLATADPV